MIKRVFIFCINLFLFIGLVTTASAAPVQYVKICTLYGAGWNYLPGTDSCINTDKGLIKSQTERGTITSNSELAARVVQLEAQLRLVYSQFGMSLPEEKQ